MECQNPHVDLFVQMAVLEVVVLSLTYVVVIRDGKERVVKKLVVLVIMVPIVLISACVKIMHCVHQQQEPVPALMAGKDNYATFRAQMTAKEKSTA